MDDGEIVHAKLYDAAGKLISGEDVLQQEFKSYFKNGGSKFNLDISPLLNYAECFNLKRDSIKISIESGWI